MTTVKVIATHAALYLVTHSVLNAVEDHLTTSGTVALAILGVSALLSFMANLWAFGGFAEPCRRNVVRAAVTTALISPLSAMVWLTLYVNIVGYES